MFAFHKSEYSSRSRQSSTDSQALDLWTSQCSDAPSQSDMHSPERRRIAHSGKRSSVFNLRSRSNTATSSTSLTLSGMAEHGSWSHESSPTPHQLEFQSQDEASGTARSLFRGKKGKRISGSIASSIDMDDDQEIDAGKKRMSILRRGRRRTNQSDSSFNNARQRISGPFDFQHLSHTDRHQFAALDEAFGDELAAGYQAGRQSSNQDSVITTANNRPPNITTSHSPANSDLVSTSTVDHSSSVRSPKSGNEIQESEFTSQVPLSRPPLRLTRSVESFSQPGVNPRTHRQSQSIVAPSRRSSLHPLTPVHDIPEEFAESAESAEKQSSPQPALSRSKRESGFWGFFDLASATGEADTFDDSEFVAHALTTPDDSTVNITTPPFSPSLEDVAEEPERFISPRPAPQPPLRTPTTPRSPFLEAFSFAGHRSPTSRNRSRGNSHASPKSLKNRESMIEPIVQDLPWQPVTYKRSPQTKSATRRQSNTWRAIEESWENDVDYIYENALEADCDFDWDFAPDDGTHNSQQQTLESATRNDSYTKTSHHTRAPSSALGNYSMYRIKPDRSNSERDAPSGIPASVVESRLQILSDTLDIVEADGFMLSPSLLLPQDYKDTRESMFQYEDVENLLGEYDCVNRQFPITDADDSAFNSARSSRVRFSRRSSYDSSLISSTQSLGLWNSPVRRSASSTASIPELVHSRRNPREFTSAVDELSEQGVALGRFHVQTDTNDITLPGRAGDGTFFASEEPLQDNSCSLAYLEEELNTSPEVASRGSQSSKKAHHKQTLSAEAASKVQATTENQSMKARSRAATISHVVRQPQLSLFPSPPRHLPAHRM
ncbi:hypothetical protein P153DRAFT_42106 [Dothidotthia symphoricarpi CBS 119687]|uniref:CRIB domain-containing protein n=1 Tax=Dothidotthia symphoricarpi CBS 119687 TaxID=1392245 RepID=A0A6A6AA32_9PLEO|nr:uncharacterized protein P153DRAFT_42106 [Dothidotthia symphoricarpi CBS 119687]KAF2128649.1 hypothetical protein P153DRAFT_42106 [Dothidotthia symphoricarpi CBS 119687]